MKTPDDIIFDELESDSNGKESFYYYSEVVKAIKSAQLDAIEATCKRCAELVEARLKDEPIIKAYLLDGSSILKVADKMKEELE